MQLLDNEASYLGQLGEDVTDVKPVVGLRGAAGRQRSEPGRADLASATDDSVAIPGSSVAELLAGLRRVDQRPRHDGAAWLWLVHAVADDRDHRFRRHGDDHRSRRRPARLPARLPNSRARSSPSPATPARSRPTAREATC